MVWIAAAVVCTPAVVAKNSGFDDVHYGKVDT
jgi:hypothetical protein